jgi:hypothetical protein
MTLEQQIKEVVDKATREVSAHIEAQLHSLSAEIGQAAAAERVSVVRDLRLAAEAEIARRSQEAVASAQADAARRLEEAVAAARAEGNRRTEEAVAAIKADISRRVDEGISSARAEHSRQLESTVAAIRTDHARELDAAVADARAESSRRADAAIEVARAEGAQALAEALARARNESSEQIEDAVRAARVEGARELADALARAAEDADRKVADALAGAAEDAERQVGYAHESARREAADQIEQSRVEALAAERQGELQQIERLLDAVRRIDGARTLSEVLDVLADVLAKEAPRVAVFLVRGGRLQGWRFAGLGGEQDPRRTDMAVDQAGLITRALRAGRAFATSELGGEAAAAPFGPLPADCAGLAVPIRVGGENVAVVYADNAGSLTKEVPSAWPEAVETLSRHAARCLEVVTVAKVSHPSTAVPESAPSPRYAPHTRSFQASGDEDDDAARRYARLLVSEIKLYHEGAVSLGRRDHNLVERLRPEIERARKLYEERVPAPVRARTDHFGQELVRTLASGDPSLLGAR